MKNIFFYLILSFSLLFFNCTKEKNEPVSNRVVILNKNGQTVIFNPKDATFYHERDEHNFSVEAVTANYNFEIGMNFPNGNGVTEIFNSTGKSNNETTFSIAVNTNEYWVATAGTADVTITDGGYPMNIHWKSIKVTFNNVQFNRCVNDTIIPGDPIWASGNLNFTPD
jgi:hypothetical protein